MRKDVSVKPSPNASKIFSRFIKIRKTVLLSFSKRFEKMYRRKHEHVLTISFSRIVSCEFFEILQSSLEACLGSPVKHPRRSFLQKYLTDIPSKHSSWWRRLEDAFYLRLQKTSSGRLDEDEYVCLSLTSAEDVFETSWSRPIYSSWTYVFKTSSRRLAKTSSRHLQDVLQRYLQDAFKAYHQVKLFFLTRLREVFNTFLRRSLFQRRLSTKEFP